MNKKVLVDELKLTSTFLRDVNFLNFEANDPIFKEKLKETCKSRITLLVKVIDKTKIETIRKKSGYILMKVFVPESATEVMLVIGHISPNDLIISIMNHEAYIFTEMKMAYLKNRKFYVFQNTRNTQFFKAPKSLAFIYFSTITESENSSDLRLKKPEETKLEDEPLENPPNLLEIKTSLDPNFKFCYRKLEDLRNINFELVPCLVGYIEEVDFNEEGKFSNGFQTSYKPITRNKIERNIYLKIRTKDLLNSVKVYMNFEVYLESQLKNDLMKWRAVAIKNIKKKVSNKLEIFFEFHYLPSKKNLVLGDALMNGNFNEREEFMKIDVDYFSSLKFDKIIRMNLKFNCQLIAPLNVKFWLKCSNCSNESKFLKGVCLCCKGEDTKLLASALNMVQDCTKRAYIRMKNQEVFLFFSINADMKEAIVEYCKDHKTVLVPKRYHINNSLNFSPELKNAFHHIYESYQNKIIVGRPSFDSLKTVNLNQINRLEERNTIMPKAFKYMDVFVNPNGALIKDEDGDNDECFDIPFIKVIHVFQPDAQLRAITILNKLI